MDKTNTNHSSASAHAHGKGAQPEHQASKLRFSRITGTLDVSAPSDCFASVILKEVAHDTRRYFSIWLLVGRHDVDALTVPYKFTGENTVKCDIPIGCAIAIASLQSGLAEFLNSEHKEPGGPPIVISDGQDP